MLADFLYRLRALLRRGDVETELEDELQFHVENHVEKLRHSGLTHEEAIRQARMKFGGVEQTKEECRRARGVSVIEALVQDAAYAVRVLRKTPAFTLTVVFSLALGIGANTAIFTLIDAVMWRMLPVERPESLLVLTHGQGGNFESGFTYQQYQLMRRHNAFLQDLAAWAPVLLNVSIDGSMEPTVSGQLVSDNYFSVLGVMPAAGRQIGAQDGQVAMISRILEATFCRSACSRGKNDRLVWNDVHDYRRYAAGVFWCRSRYGPGYLCPHNHAALRHA